MSQPRVPAFWTWIRNLSFLALALQSSYLAYTIQTQRAFSGSHLLNAILLAGPMFWSLSRGQSDEDEIDSIHHSFGRFALLSLFLSLVALMLFPKPLGKHGMECLLALNVILGFGLNIANVRVAYLVNLFLVTLMNIVLEPAFSWSFASFLMLIFSASLSQNMLRRADIYEQGFDDHFNARQIILALAAVLVFWLFVIGLDRLLPILGWDPTGPHRHPIRDPKLLDTQTGVVVLGLILLLWAYIWHRLRALKKALGRSQLEERQWVAWKGEPCPWPAGLRQQIIDRFRQYLETLDSAEIRRHEHESAREFIARLITDHAANEELCNKALALFEWARYSPTPMPQSAPEQLDSFLKFLETPYGESS